MILTVFPYCEMNCIRAEVLVPCQIVLGVPPALGGGTAPAPRPPSGAHNSLLTAQLSLELQLTATMLDFLSFTLSELPTVGSRGKEG